MIAIKIKRPQSIPLPKTPCVLYIYIIPTHNIYIYIFYTNNIFFFTGSIFNEINN